MKQSFGNGSHQFESSALDTLGDPNIKDIDEIDRKLKNVAMEEGQDVSSTLYKEEGKQKAFSEAHEEANRVNSNIDRVTDWKEALQVNENRDAQATKEQVDYETARSAVVAKFERIKKGVRDQTDIVRSFENSNEEKYEESLAALREVENETLQRRTEMGMFLSRYWGQNLEDHKRAKEQFKEDIAGATSIADLAQRIEAWGGIAEDNEGEFMAFSDLAKLMEEVFAVPFGSERARRLQALDINPEVKNKLIELYAMESESVEEASGEYAKILTEEQELREINDIVHLPAFQSAMRFPLWSAHGENKAKLELLKKHNITYDNALARKSAAPVGAALKLNAVLHQKKELERILPKREQEEARFPLPQMEEPEIREEPLIVEEEPEKAIPEFVIPSREEEPETETEDYLDESPEIVSDSEELLKNIEKVSGIKAKENAEELTTPGREEKRLEKEMKRLQKLKKTVHSKLFLFSPRLYWGGTARLRELEELSIPFKTEDDKKHADALLDQKLQEMTGKHAAAVQARKKLRTA